MADISPDRPKGKSLKPLRALAPFLAPHWRVLAFALTALVVAAVAQLALPVALRYLIDEGLAMRDAATINRYFVLFLARGRRVRRVRGAAVLSRDVARRARRRGRAQHRVRERRADGSDVLRGHAHGRSLVAAHGRYHARAVDLGRRHLDHAAFDADAARRARDARLHEPDAGLDDRRADAAHRRVR